MKSTFWGDRRQIGPGQIVMKPFDVLIEFEQLHFNLKKYDFESYLRK